MTRQNFYAQRKCRQRKEINEELIVHLVKEQKKLHPQMGGRKMRHILQKDLRTTNVQIGRDLWFELLKRNGLLVERRKTFHPKTTNSNHYLPTFKNLLKGKIIDAPNQAWVGDITYIRTRQGFMYASLITDCYSRKIVGSHIDDKLEADGCLKSLEMAIRSLPQNQTPIHHSDRGSQYCSHRYVKKAQKGGLKLSMTEENHCYENAMAERINGILKYEYGLKTDFKTKAQARRAFKQAVFIYNHLRPHLSLEYAIPAEVHQQKVA